MNESTAKVINKVKVYFCPFGSLKSIAIIDESGFLKHKNNFDSYDRFTNTFMKFDDISLGFTYIGREKSEYLMSCFKDKIYNLETFSMPKGRILYGGYRWKISFYCDGNLVKEIEGNAYEEFNRLDRVINMISQIEKIAKCDLNKIRDY